MITCKGKSEILKMERAARIVHEALAECVAACRPGVTTEEIDRTPVTPCMPFIAVSSGKVMSCSTSSGAIPPASVIKVTVGRLRSGKTSTGMRVSVRAP